MKKSQLVLLSGGLDSAVLAYKLKNEGKNLRALYVDFGGSRVMPETTSAKAIARRLDIPFEIAKIPDLRELFIGYIPLGLASVDGGDSKWCGVTGKPEDLPFPAWRNGKIPTAFPIMCSIALYYSHIAEIDSISLALIKEQLDSYPHIKDFFALTTQADKAINGTSDPVSFETPFINLTKTDLVKLSEDLGVPTSVTWSCVKQGEIHCGVCSRCMERKAAFKAAGVADPTSYRE
jgi:7-cyano-7-deazaguanine synthase